jgi:hypothetical protein
MSWQLTRMSTWLSAGGIAVADLGPCDPARSSIRFELGARGEARFELHTDIAYDLVANRAVIRVDLEDGTWHEFRVNRRGRPTRGVEANRCSVVAKPRIFDLSDSDLVREVLGGRSIYTFNLNLTIAAAWARLVAPNASTDRLAGIALGEVQYPAPVPLTFTRWTYGQLLQGWLDATKLELQWRRSADGMTEYVDFLEQVGSSAPTVPLFYGGQLQDHGLEEDYDALFTVARIVGEPPSADSEAATIGENAWRVASSRPLGGGRFAVELRELYGSRSPVVQNGQFAAHGDIGLPARFLQFADGITRTEILDAFAESGEVVVAMLPPSGDPHVSIVADAAGTALETIELPDAVRKYGYVVGDVPIDGARGERQYLRNGGHEQGLTAWSAVNGGAAAEIRRNELGVTVTAAADGARAAGVGPGTPFAVRGLAPNVGRVIRGDELRVGGAVLPITVDAIPNTTGVLTLSLGAPGLPGNFPDGHPFLLLRRETRTLTLDGVQNPFNPYLVFRDTNTDGMFAANAGTLDSAVGGFFVQPGNQATVNNYEDAPLRAGRIRVTVQGTSMRGALNWATYQADAFVMSGVNFSYTVGASTGTLTFVSMAAQVGGGNSTIVVGSVIRYISQNSNFAHLRVTAIDGTTYTVATLDGGPIPGWSGLGSYEICNVLLADGSTWTYTAIRETRTVLCNGPVTAGAVSLPCKAQANIATRNWVATDTINMTRAVSGTLAVTGITSTVGYEDEFGNPILGMQAVVTYDAATSTVDDLTGGGVDWSFGDVLFDLGSTGRWRLASIGGGSATLENYDLWYTPTPFTTPQTASASWVKTDTYALTGTASWGTNGRVTLTLASAIPAGRSYARGLPVGSNWVSGFLRLHAARSGGANTVELFGHDAFFSNTAPSSPSRGALYRVTASGSTMPIPGDTLYAQGTVTADALGEALVPLQAANVNVIADGAPITITRPQLVASTEPQTGSVLRLFCQVGGVTGEPSSSTPGWGHELARFNVPVGSTRQITALSVFGLSVFDWMAPQGPVVAIVDSAGNILGWSALGEDGALIEVAPGVVALQTRAVIATGGQYTVRVYGGSPTSYTRWCVHVRTMLFQGEADDVPYTRESYASLLQLTGTRALVEGARPRVTDTVTVTEFLALHAQALGVSPTLLPRITLGGLVHIEDVDRIARVTAMTRRSGTSDSEIELGTVGPDGGRLLGATALAAGTRRPR